MVECGILILGNGGIAEGLFTLEGTIRTGNIWVNKTNSVANFDGGTVIVTASTADADILRGGSGTANILDGGLTIDTNRFDDEIS